MSTTGKVVGVMFMVLVLVLAVSGVALSVGVGRVAWKKRAARQTYRGMVWEAAQSYDLDPDLVCAIIRVESGWRVHATGAQGELGLMQISPAAWRHLKKLKLVDGPHDWALIPTVNVRAGCAYLDWLRKSMIRSGGQFTTRRMVSAYNCGLDRLHRYNWELPNRAYVDRVMRYQIQDGQKGRM